MTAASTFFLNPFGYLTMGLSPPLQAAVPHCADNAGRNSAVGLKSKCSLGPRIPVYVPVTNVNDPDAIEPYQREYTHLFNNLNNFSP